FFQAEDGIRDRNVTGVQTCALPIYRALPRLDGGFCSSEQTAPERGRQKEPRWRKYLEIRSFFGFLCKRLGKMLAVCRAMGYNSPKVAALPGLSSPVLPAPWADGNRRIRSAGPAESGCKRWGEMAWAGLTRKIIIWTLPRRYWSAPLAAGFAAAPSLSAMMRLCPPAITARPGAVPIASTWAIASGSGKTFPG